MKKTNILEVFSFFTFYFYLFSKNEKRYMLAENEKTARYILGTPMVFSVVTVLFALFTLNMIFIYAILAHILLVMATLVFVNLTSADNYYKEQEFRAEERRKQKQQGKRSENQRYYVPTLDESYKVLGISPYSDIQTVKIAYRRLSKIHHPDMPNGDSRKFIAIKRAYEQIKSQRSA